jgi:hypothetical protein
MGALQSLPKHARGTRVFSLKHVDFIVSSHGDGKYTLRSSLFNKSLRGTRVFSKTCGFHCFVLATRELINILFGDLINY